MMSWAANITVENWVGLLQVTLFVFIILLGFPMAFTLLAMSVIFGYYAFLIQNCLRNLEFLQIEYLI